MFSVIIPTLQRSPVTPLLVDMYCSHPLVAEVIIVNNSVDLLSSRHSKLRVLEQGRNTFVNPAWNLGVAQARSEFLVISNDDIVFNSHVLDVAAKALRLPVGIIGPDEYSFRRSRDDRLWVSPSYRRTSGFGTLMFLRRDNYIPIPPDLRVWYGDDWLFTRQRRRNLHLHGACIETRMHTTAASPEFDEVKRKDGEAYAGHGTGGDSDRYRAERIIWRATRKFNRATWRRGLFSISPDETFRPTV